MRLTRPRATKLSQITMDIKIVGDQIELDGIKTVRETCTLSDALRKFDDTQYQYKPTVWAKQTDIVFGAGFKGSARIKFDLWAEGIQTGYGILTRNGATPGTGDDLGVQQSESGDSPVVKSQDIDIPELSYGDTVSLWLKCNGSVYGYVKDFRIYFDGDLDIRTLGVV